MSLSTYPDDGLCDLRRQLAGMPVWIITDGKAGDRAPCLGVAETLDLAIEERVTRPGPLAAALMPWGPMDPRERPERPGSPFAQPWPALAFGSGRRAVAVIRHLTRQPGPRPFTVFFKDPRTGAGTADLLWVPAHDTLRGDNVIVTDTAPHSFSAARLAEAGQKPAPWGAPDGRRRLAVLLGGDSRHHRFTAADQTRLADALDRAARHGARLLLTPSRRTPTALLDRLRALVERHDGYLWGGAGENPYPLLLAQADAFVVTADSTNMAGEAASTGRPLHIFRPSGGHPRLDRAIATLEAAGAARPFTGELGDWRYTPIDATPGIALAVARAYLHRGPRPPSAGAAP